MGDSVMHLRQVGTGLASRVAVSLFAWILLTAQAGMMVSVGQPLQQAQVASAPHKQALKDYRALQDYSGAAGCGPVVLRDALSVRHAMPDVRGCAYPAVRGYFLEFGGHAVARQDEASSLAVDLIARQAPDPGIALAAGQSVTLYVSSGLAPPPPPLQAATVPMIMPRVTERTEANALIVLHQVGLRNVISRSSPSGQPKGVVYMQTPGPGSTVSAGTPVLLGISQGASTVVPMVVGRPAGDAEAAIRARQLQPASRVGEDGAHPRGEVIRTMPPAGTVVDRGTEVGYWAASGYNKVPDLYLLSPEDARVRMREAGFWPGQIDERSTSENAGRILAQQPMAGTRAVVGTAIATSVGIPSHPPALVVAAVLGSLLVLGGGWGLRHKLRIARTRRLLRLKPSCGPGGAIRFIVAPHFNAPTVTLRSRLENGETRFRDSLPVLHVEIRHD
jgi:beta-lactam-binding protein with PASTA domain